MILSLSLFHTQFADDEDLQNQWRIAKRNNKLKAVSFLKEKTGYTVSPDAMFDIQVICFDASSSKLLCLEIYRCLLIYPLLSMFFHCPTLYQTVFHLIIPFCIVRSVAYPIFSPPISGEAHS